MNRSSFLLAALTLTSALALSHARDDDADPTAEFAVTPDAGPWMICATSYTGPKAPQMAHDLVAEVREDYKLRAYVFNRGAKERQEQREHLRKLHEMTNNDPIVKFRTYRIEEQCAVLIGGYKDMDSATKALKDIKKLKPPKRVPADTVFLAGPDAAAKGEKKGVVTEAAVNPFTSSFVVRNPTVPQEKVEEKSDQFVKKLNDGRPYNLFRCRQPWTLAVAQYDGAMIEQPRSTSGAILSTLFGSSSAEYLNASARQAEEVAKTLHKIYNVDTFVLHTRYSSVVTVGGFESKDDPKMAPIQRQLANLSFTGGQPLRLFANPRPMEVPRY